MRDFSINQKSLVLSDNDLFIIEEHLCLSFDNNEQVIMLMGMLFQRSAAFQGDIGYGPSMISPTPSNSFFASKFTWSGGVINPSLILKILSCALNHFFFLGFLGFGAGSSGYMASSRSFRNSLSSVLSTRSISFAPS